MSVIQYQKDEQNIVHIVFDNTHASANIMDDVFAHEFAEAINKLKQDNFVGVMVRSTKKTFFVGGDLSQLSQVNHDNAEQLFNMVSSIKSSMRILETCGKPVVACISGSALGGGWELALACHYRIVVDNKQVQLGLPEVTLGLLPGAGGIVRTVRLLGLEKALPLLTKGRLMDPRAALETSLVDELVATEELLMEKSKLWILQQKKAYQPWDDKGYRLPGGKPSHPALAQKLPLVPAMLKMQTKGVLPAPESIVCVMVEGANVDFETALKIETGYFIELVKGQIAKNFINTFWFQLNEIKAGVDRPSNYPLHQTQKVGILGAGMMGAGIAYACAIRGIPVVLKDVSKQSAELGKQYSVKLLDKRVACGKMSEIKKQQILSLIHPTSRHSELANCDLIIEAVFENREIKAQVTTEVENVVSEQTIFASNTSTLPITGLASASRRPQQFIGLHFFSPVEKMSLVEIIVGKQTNQETLAKCYDFVLQIAKTPIIVNDSRGFFTSRVFGTFINEGIAMLGEGVSAASIENAAFLSGFPIGPLAVTDEVSLTLVAKIKQQAVADAQAKEQTYVAHPAELIIDRMLEMERAGKSTGGGFYDYPKGQKKHLWGGLKKYFASPENPIELEDIKERLLFIMAIETVHCIEENVLRSTRDANIGSIFGIGFPSWTGGTLQFINQYGPQRFLQRSEQLAERYGERFNPPNLLRQKVENNEEF